MSGEANIEILISVAQQSSAAVANLNKDLKAIVEQLQKVATKNTSTTSSGMEVLGKKTKEAESSVSKLSRSFETLKHWTAIAAGGFVAFESVSFLKHLADSGAEAEALAFGLKVVGENAGYAAEEMEKAVKSLQSIGLSDEAASKNLQKFISNGINPETAISLGRAARVLANQTVQDVDNVMQRITQAVMTGRLRGLKAMGVMINEENILRAAALKKQADLTPAERRSALAEGVTAKIQATRGGRDQEGEDLAATKVRDLAKAWNEAGQAMGTTLQGPYKQILQMSIDTAKAIEHIGIAVGEATNNFQGLQNFITTTSNVLGFLVELFKEYWQIVALAAVGVGAFVVGFVGFAAVLASIAAIIPIVIGAVAAWLLLTERGQKVLEVMGRAVVGVGIDLLRLMVIAELAAAGMRSFWETINPFDTPEAATANLEAVRKKLDDLNKQAEENTAGLKKAAEEAVSPSAPKVEPKIRTKEDRENEAKARLKKAEEDEEAAAESAARVRGLASAAAGAAVQARSTEAAVRRAQLEREELQNKDAYDKGLKSVHSYYDQKLEALRQNAEKEQAVNKAAVAKAAVDRDAAVDKAKGGKSFEVVQAQQNAQVKAANDKKILADEKYESDKARLQDSYRRELEGKERQKIQTFVNLLELQGQTLRAELTKNAETEKAGLEKAVDTEERLHVQRMKNLKDENAQIKEATDLLKLRSDIQTQEIDRQQARLEAGLRKGTITEFESYGARTSIINQRIAVQQQLLDKAFETLRIHKATEGIDTKILLQDELAVRSLQGSIEDLADSVVTLGDELERTFADRLGEALNGFLSNTKTFKQSLYAFAESLSKEFTAMTAKNAAQTFTNMLVANTGGKGNSIFDSLANYLTGGSGGKPDGSASNPIYTIQKGLPGLGTGGGGDDLPGIDSEIKKVIDPIKTGFEGMFNQIGDSLKSFVNGLGAVITSLMSTLTASSAAGGGGGGGGFLGFLGGLFKGGGSALGAGGGPTAGFGEFAIAVADGGMLDGPSHAEGGVPIEAEGGEFVVNKRSSTKYRRLLDSINSDKLGGVVPPGGAKRPKFAMGGAVAGGGFSGGQPVRVQINQTIQTPDVDSFRRSRDQVAAQAATAASRAMRRNR